MEVNTPRGDATGVQEGDTQLETNKEHKKKNKSKGKARSNWCKTRQGQVQLHTLQGHTLTYY